jgi:hypothetical protein
VDLDGSALRGEFGSDAGVGAGNFKIHNQGGKLLEKSFDPCPRWFLIRSSRAR